MLFEAKSKKCLSIAVAFGCTLMSVNAETIANPVSRKVMNPTLDQLAEGTWYVGPDMPSPGAQYGNSAVYSGFVFDTRRGQLIKRGGGHCDYKGTEVQEFDALDTLTWSIASPSVPDTEYLPSNHFDDRNFPGAVVVLADGSAPSNFAAAVAAGQAVPIARHTTNSTTFIESTGEFFMTGQYTYGEGSSGCVSGGGLPYSWSPEDAWAYDPASRTWRYLAQHNLDMEWAGCAWAPQGSGVTDQLGAVFCITEQTRELFRYDVSADRWSTANNNVPSSGLGINLTYSDRFRSLYYYRSGNLYRYQLSNGNWQQVSTGGSVGADDWSRTAYDSNNDVIGVWDANRLYLCELSDSSTCAWNVATTQGMPGGRSGAGSSSNFTYDAIHNVFWAATQDGFGAYKFKEGAGIPAPVQPEPPADLDAN